MKKFTLPRVDLDLKMIEKTLAYSWRIRRKNRSLSQGIYCRIIYGTAFDQAVAVALVPRIKKKLSLEQFQGLELYALEFCSRVCEDLKKSEVDRVRYYAELKLIEKMLRETAEPTLLGPALREVEEICLAL